MIPAEDFDIVGSYNNQRVSSIDPERAVNIFQYNDLLGKKKKTNINTSGLINTNSDFGAVTGGFRAQFVFGTIQYDVIGGNIFQRNSSGVVSLLGTIGTTTGYVGVDANTFQVIFVDGMAGYIWDTNASTFTQITDTSFPLNPIDVCYLDGFFLVLSGGTPDFELSSYNQGLVWGPSIDTFTADDTGGNNWLILSSTDNYQTGVPFTLSTTGSLPMPLTTDDTYYAINVDSTHIRVATSYANAIAGTPITLTSDGSPTNTITSLGQLQLGSISSHPGNIVACRTLHRRVFLFSLNFTEVWENAGIGTTLPFRRNNSLLLEYGTNSIGSISVSFDTLIFLSQTKNGLGPVIQLTGTTAIPISTRALDFQLSLYDSLNQLSDCRGFLVKENGLIFYRMNFTAANHTWVYDVTQSNPQDDSSKYWHEEEVLNGNRHPAQTIAYLGGINFVGHYASPILYILSSQTYTNDGEKIRRMRISRPMTVLGYQRRRVDRLQLDLLQGNVAALNPDGTPIATTDLVVFLSISKDGGQTYGSLIRAPMGQPGQRTFRTVWRKLGVTPRGQAFVAKFEWFTEVPVIILGGSWVSEILPE